MSIYRKLMPTEYPLYSDHLLRLPSADRYSRFSGTVSDSAVKRHCQNIDWTRTTLIGAFTNGVLTGAAELCTDRALWPGSAEMALSVDRTTQGCGVGAQLVRRTLTMARNRNIADVHMISLAGNHRIRALGKRFGGKIELDGGESYVTFRLPPPNQFSFALEAIEDGAGVITSVLDIMQTARALAA